jgi:hypothetical protein
MQPHTATQSETAPYMFTARELARLAIYRAAIVARFYTDELEAVMSPRPRGLSKLAVG